MTAAEIAVVKSLLALAPEAIEKLSESENITAKHLASVLNVALEIAQFLIK
jgi:hypothetical protein